MTTLHQCLIEQAQTLANARGVTVWVCTPRHGRPFLTVTPEAIPSSYERLATFVPTPRTSA